MNGPTQTKFRVDGMDCASCARKIDTAVRRMPGISDVAVSVTAGTMTVTHDDTIDLEAVGTKLSGLGFQATPIRPRSASAAPVTEHALGAGPEIEHHADHGGHDHSPSEGPWWSSRKGRLTIMAGTALVLAYGIGLLFPDIATYAFIVAMLVGLVPIARRAIMAAMAGTPFSIEMLMTIAAVGALFIDATEEAAAVVLLFLVGELLEGVAA
ncbi:cation transporter, partial [Pseudorhizobium flavum]